MSNDHPIWQAEVERIYEAWREDKQPYDDFVDELPKRDRQLMILANLNYQVENGGFEQWIENGYGSQAKRVIKALYEINTEASLKAAELVEEAAEYIDFDSPCGSHIAVDDSEDEDEYEEVCNNLDKLDTVFYSINDKLVDDIEEWAVKILAK